MNTTPNHRRRLPILGCIADDVTGATDLALNLVQGGMCVTQVFGVPSVAELAEVDADAIVVALKTRSILKDDAISQSVCSVESLRQAGIDRFFFKYCSTFDSTITGNIGPVAEALMDSVGTHQTIFCPAFPRNGRTVYQGHLFVRDRLLNESGMENHPLNPMTDANLVRFLAKQTTFQVGLLSLASLSKNADQVRLELQNLAESGVRMVITDACDDDHLAKLARAVDNMPLLTGGSGIAKYLPAAYRNLGILNSIRYEPTIPKIAGRSFILSGSCSTATNRQIKWMSRKCPNWKISIPDIFENAASVIDKIVQWVQQFQHHEPILIYSTSHSEEVKDLQNQFGIKAVAKVVEEFMAQVAKVFVSQLGFHRLVVAGGETSGAIVHKLNIKSLRIGPEICAGVPWTETVGKTPLALALKSGNFGEDDFFEAALEMLP